MSFVKSDEYRQRMEAFVTGLAGSTTWDTVTCMTTIPVRSRRVSPHLLVTDNTLAVRKMSHLASFCTLLLADSGIFTSGNTRLFIHKGNRAITSTCEPRTALLLKRLSAPKPMNSHNPHRIHNHPVLPIVARGCALLDGVRCHCFAAVGCDDDSGGLLTASARRDATARCRFAPRGNVPSQIAASRPRLAVEVGAGRRGHESRHSKAGVCVQFSQWHDALHVSCRHILVCARGLGVYITLLSYVCTFFYPQVHRHLSR